MIRRLILVGGALLSLTACDSGDRPKATAPAASAPALVTRQDKSGAVDRFTPYESGPLALDEFSVGPIMAQTEFSLDAIEQRFPKAKVGAASLHEGEGEPTPIISVEQDGRVLEIQGNPGTLTVGDIRITGGSPQGPRGEILGMRWADADMDYPRCWMGKDRDLHAVICTQPGEPVLRYVFAVPGWTRDTMPPEAVLRDKAVLREFLWRGGAPVQ
jgi:hypothetical protein